MQPSFHKHKIKYEVFSRNLTSPHYCLSQSSINSTTKVGSIQVTPKSTKKNDQKHQTNRQCKRHQLTVFSSSFFFFCLSVLTGKCSESFPLTDPSKESQKSHKSHLRRSQKTKIQPPRNSSPSLPSNCLQMYFTLFYYHFYIVNLNRLTENACMDRPKFDMIQTI